MSENAVSAAHRCLRVVRKLIQSYESKPRLTPNEQRELQVVLAMAPVESCLSLHGAQEARAALQSMEELAAQDRQAGRQHRDAASSPAVHDDDDDLNLPRHSAADSKRSLLHPQSKPQRRPATQQSQSRDLPADSGRSNRPVSSAQTGKRGVPQEDVDRELERWQSDMNDQRRGQCLLCC
mgnify:CR=1 FL=1